MGTVNPNVTYKLRVTRGAVYDDDPIGGELI